MKRAMLAVMTLTGLMTAAGGQASAGRKSVCDAARVQMFVGALGTADVGRTATDRAGAKTLRWLRPGMAVTMDFRPDRLNIEVDERNFIRALRCG